ncbi:MAG: amidohydrolase family protein [Planctomycetes bacterium]|nr:amidohydrolase family protein [Planctomycetota bacterium]
MTAFTRIVLWACASAALPLFAQPAVAMNAWPQDPPKEEVQQPPVEEVEEAEPEEVQEAEEEAAPKKSAPSPYLAVVGGDVYTVTRGVIAGGTVLCKNNRILKVGQNIQVPEGARVIDAVGMRVYPGLVAVNSRGIIRGNGTEARDSFDPFNLMVDLGLASGLTTVQSSLAIGKLTRGTLEGHLLATADWVNLSLSGSSPSSKRKLRAQMDEAREYLRQLRDAELAQKLGEKDVKMPDEKKAPQEHLGLLTGERMARFNASNAKDLLAICEFLEEYPMKSVIFGGLEAWTYASRLGRVGASVVVTPRQKRWADENLNRESGWSIENARILWEHGVEVVILPSQTSISLGGLAGRDLMNLPMEAAFAIRGGLPQDAALRAVTINAAHILGVADRIGSIEPGKDADLIICNGDLFDYRTFVEWAVVNGREVYDKQRATYFAHIRPRPETEPTTPLETLVEVLDDMDETDSKSQDVDVPEVEPQDG